MSVFQVLRFVDSPCTFLFVFCAMFQTCFMNIFPTLLKRKTPVHTHTDAHMAQLTIIYLGVFSESVFAAQTAEVVQLTS